MESLRAALMESDRYALQSAAAGSVDDAPVFSCDLTFLLACVFVLVVRTKHDLEKQTRTLQDKVVSLEAVLHVVQSDIHHIRLQSKSRARQFCTAASH